METFQKLLKNLGKCCRKSWGESGKNLVGHVGVCLRKHGRKVEKKLFGNFLKVVGKLGICSANTWENVVGKVGVKVAKIWLGTWENV